MRNAVLFMVLCATMFACAPSVKQENKQEEGASISLPQDTRAAIQQAHGFQQFMSREAIEFHLNLSFGGKPRVDALHRMTTNTSFIRMDYADGKTLVGDGSLVLLNPDTADFPRARFDIFTWSYFFALPFKLSDPGTKWEDLGQQALNGKMYNVGKLSFEASVGDAPDDWYMIYSDPETNLLYAAAYIVTFGKTQAEAEKDPHAIVYSAYKQVDGIPFPTEWSFHSWSTDGGLIDTLGQGNITNLKFITEEDVYPEKTNGWQEVAR